MVKFQKIKVAVLPVPEIMEINSSHDIIELSGYEGKFLQLILSELGMEYEIVIPKDRQWGLQQNNGSWTGLIGLIERGEAHMACTFLAMTDQRLEAVDFSSSYASEVYTFATHISDSYKSNFAILHPFHETVWICLCIVFLITSIVYAQLQERRTSTGSIFYKLFASVLKQPQKMYDKTGESSIFLFIWWVFALIISLSYSATLLSFVMLPSKENPISSIYELSKAVQGGSHQCIASKDGSELISLRNSKEDYLSKLGNIIYSNKWFVNSSSINSEYSIQKGRSQLIYKNLAKLLFGAREDISISEDSFMIRPLAIALSRTFCCKIDLNSAISRLASAGIYDKHLKDSSVKHAMKTKIIKTISPIHPLTVNDTIGALVILTLGYLLSCFVLLWEMFLYDSKNGSIRDINSICSKTFHAFF